MTVPPPAGRPGTRRRRSVPLLLLIGLVICALTVPALANWSTPGSGSGRSAGTTVNGGNTPTTSVAGSTVTLNWTASTLANAAAVSGYLIKRYDSGGTVAQVVASGTCASLVVATSCAETSVPVGSWKYSVTPTRGNWLGAQSTKVTANVVGLIPPPIPTITSRPPDATTSTSATFAFTDTQPLVTFQCQLDGGGFTTCTSPITYTGLAEGPHTFLVRALDLGGGASSTATDTWTVDLTAPSVDVTFPVTGTAYNAAGYNAGCGTTTTGDVCGTAADAGSGVSSVKVSLRQGTGNYWTGSAFSSAAEVLLTVTGTTSWTYAFAATSFPVNGDYTLRAVATDAAGTTASDSSTFAFDTVAPPAPTITAGPANPTSLNTASFSFTDTEPGTSFQCQLDGGGFSVCTSPKAYTGLTAVAHTFQVRAADDAGNLSGATSYTWTINAYTRYLKTSGLGNVTSSPLLPLALAGPTVTTLPNYDTDRDSAPGLLILKGGTSTSTDPTKYQAWSDPQTADVTVTGIPKLTFWSAMANFGTGKKGVVTGYLYDCVTGSTSCALLKTKSLSVANWSGGSTTWVSKTITFATVTRTIVAGHELRVRLIVTTAAVDNMWFAYDTTAYPTRLVIG